jgi:hypothetical protein
LIIFLLICMYYIWNMQNRKRYDYYHFLVEKASRFERKSWQKWKIVEVQHSLFKVFSLKNKKLNFYSNVLLFVIGIRDSHSEYISAKKSRNHHIWFLNKSFSLSIAFHIY